MGGALATNWSKKGHSIHLGVQDENNFKGQELLKMTIQVILQLRKLLNVRGYFNSYPADGYF